MRSTGYPAYRQGMKGQLTIEYLFLALIALALISISFTALLKIKDAGERIYHLELFKSGALDIYNSGEELCAMGSGNSMKLRIREGILVSYGGGEAVFSNPELNFSISKKTACAYSQADMAADSEIEIQNEGGEIKIIKKE